MSGFAGVIHLDGKPLQPETLQAMTGPIERHGGDALNTQLLDNAGFSFSLLRTKPKAVENKAPFTFDQKTWITGDIRLDAREELARNLQNIGRQAHQDLPDIELALHAYCAWGESCTTWLMGDFAFAIWDSKRSLLFCARDHFGIMPFYYARNQETFVFSNDIDALRAHPMVSQELDSAAVCDFLAFGFNLDESTTVFNDIARLPPGHAMTVTLPKPPRKWSYRKLEAGKRIRYSNQAEYSEHYLELFTKAVSDRLRTQSAVVELSGGMDSTSIAAMAMHLEGKNPEFQLTGITSDYSRVDTNDKEAHFAAMTADRAGFKHEVMPAALDEDFFAFNDTAQPSAWAFNATLLRFATRVKSFSNVMLSGHGGDPFTMASGFYLLDQFREKSFPAFFTELLGLTYRRKSLRGMGLSSLWKPDISRIPLPAVAPWIRPEILQQSGSVERWRALFGRSDRYPSGCQSELAWDEAHMPSWSHIFENYYHDLFPGIDSRQPLFDIRLVNFLLAVPPSQKQDKKLIRRAMQGKLPGTVINREKSIAHVDVLQRQISKSGAINNLNLSFNKIENWLDGDAFFDHLQKYRNGKTGDRFTMACPINLCLWIESKL